MIISKHQKTFRGISILLFTIIIFVLLTSCNKSESKINKQPNILLITIDTLRRDHLGVYGYPRNTSPFIDQLAREGIVFRNVFTPIPNTAASHASILTSLHPLTHNVTSNAGSLSGNVQTIAEVFKKGGYYTIGTVSVPFLSRQYNFHQGFDDFSDSWETPGKSTADFERPAHNTNKSLFEQIDTYLKKHNGQPLFIWVHYFDPHFTYTDWKHISFKNKIPQWEDDDNIRNYDKEIRYTDSQIELLHNKLREAGIAKQMITCITADHGEQLHDHGGAYFHADIYTENTMVPLIFHGYGIPENKIVDSYVSTMDIAPTLLGKCYLSFNSPIEGINLLQGEKVFENYPKRNFLIIGCDLYTRSLNFVAPPLSFIMNFDRFYKHWYIAYKNSSLVPELFKPARKKWLKNIDSNGISLRLPHHQARGLNYCVIRGNIKNNKGIKLQIHMLQNSFTDKIDLPLEARTFEILYPVTIRDRILLNFFPDTNTQIDFDSLSYTFISRKDFPNSDSLTTLDNPIFKKLITLRKEMENDELYDLSNDLEMVSNLLDEQKYTRNTIEYRKNIYLAYRNYLKKQQKLLKGISKKDNYSEKEKEMLKTLGYL